MPNTPMLLAVTRAAEGPQVVTEPLGASMRRRVSNTNRLSALSEARDMVVVKVAAVPIASA